MSQSSSAQPAPRATRRRCTVEEKLRILAEYETAVTPEAGGAALRSEGIYSSHIALWRQKRASGRKVRSIESAVANPILLRVKSRSCVVRTSGLSRATSSSRRSSRSREKCRRSCTSSGARRQRRRPSHYV